MTSITVNNLPEDLERALSVFLHTTPRGTPRQKVLTRNDAGEVLLRHALKELGYWVQPALVNCPCCEGGGKVTKEDADLINQVVVR